MANAAKTKARKAAYYLANKEAAILAAKEYRLKNKEKIKQSRVIKYQENRQEILALSAIRREPNKEKARLNSAKWRIENPEKAKESRRNYCKNNKNKVAESLKAWASKNAEYIKNYSSQYYAENFDKYLAKVAKRRAKKIKATPKWDEEFTEFVMAESAKLVRLRNKIFCIKWHVDHVIPLQGKLVSGLHVWNNLQVIPAFLNLAKSNKYIVN